MTEPPAAFAPLDDIALLRWYDVAGVDECIGEAPVDRFAADAARAERRARAAAPPPAPKAAQKAAQKAAPAASPPASDTSAAPGGSARAGAAAVAAEAVTLDQLRAALEGFDGCPLKVTATHLVFGEGAAAGGLMVVGEAPGADEDRQGRPFCGVSGRLLDDMLASIGYDRSTAYITNVVPWRPPGNRKPTPAEVAVCAPFVARHVALVAPRVLLLVGGLAAATLLGTSAGITRLRGQWHSHRPEAGAAEIPAMPTFHPAYLLRNPDAKRLVWRDLLAVRQALADAGNGTG